MNILFYVEPLIEKNDPLWKAGWLKYCCGNIIKTLRASQVTFDFLIALNEPLSAVALDFDAQKVIFSQQDLLAPFQHGYLEATIAWYKESFTAEQLSYYVELMHGKLGGFTPDVIITFSPAPFFKAAYPSALLLHHEYSIFSRSPYPESWFLDPCGMSEQAFTNRFKGQYDTELSSTESLLVKAFKRKCAEIMDQTSPFKAILAQERKRFQHLVLLPLQDSSYYSFEGIVGYRSQYDFLVDVLETVPSDIGIVVTMHPDYPVIKHSAFDYLKRKYPNCIFYPEFSDYNSVSQFLVSETDAVITVSSTVGLQTAFFDKKLITLGNTFSYLAGCTSLTDIRSYLTGPLPDNDAILNWIITRYAIQKQHMLSPDWLSSFLLRSVQHFREAQGITKDFYHRIRPSETIYEDLMQHMDKQVPALPQPARTTNLPYAQLYFDTGAGFDETQSLKIAIGSDNRLTRLSFRPLPDAEIRGLRFDPLSDFVSLELADLYAKTPAGRVPLTIEGTNAAWQVDNVHHFNSKDPVINIACPEVNLLEVVIDLKYLFTGEKALANMIEAKKAEEANNLQAVKLQDEAAARLRDAIEQGKVRALELEAALKQSEFHAAKILDSLVQATETATRLDIDVKAKEQLIQELESSAALQKHEFDMLQETARNQKQQLEQLEEVILNQKHQILESGEQAQGQARQIEGLIATLNDLEARFGELGTTAQAQKQEIELLQKSLAGSNELAAKLDLELEASRQESAKLAAKLNLELDASRQESAGLSRELCRQQAMMAQVDEILAQEVLSVEKYRSDAEETIAKLRMELAASDAAVRERDQLISTLGSEAREQRQRIDDLLNSGSWRVTAPLRKVYKLLRKN